MKSSFSSLARASLVSLCPFVLVSGSQAEAREVRAGVGEALTAPVFDAAPRGVVHDEPGDGRLWAVGSSWKASFGADGVTYYPRVGRHEPRRLPHALSPDVVTIGGAPIEFARAAHPVRDGDRVEFDRGSFVERYDLALDVVEQSFVFDSLPGEGELVLRIPVASELGPCETEAGLEFRGEHARITYSRAVAVDALGRRTVIPTRIEDGAITIRVGADVIANAAFPLVIDPLVGSIFAPDGSTTDAFAVDSAYDVFNGVWIVVYETVFSATDHDVYAKVYGSAGTILAENSIDVTGDSWVEPHVADLASAHKFLVVAGSTAAVGGAKTVRGRIAYPNGTLLSTDPQFSISGSLTGICIEPDVGGDSTTGAPGNWCVVFHRNLSGVHTLAYTLITAAGTVALAPTPVPAPAGASDAAPSISKSNDGSAWALAWERSFSLNASIRAARISSAGLIVTNPFSVVSGTFFSDPAVSSPLSGTSRYAVVWRGGSPAAPGGSSIGIALVDDGTILHAADLMILESSTTTAENQGEPSVDSDGAHLLVGYSEFNTAFAFDQAFVTDLAVAGNTLVVSQAHLVLGRGNRTAVAAARAPIPLAQRFIALWDFPFFTPAGTDHDISGRFVDALVGGPVTPYCFGDGTGTACPCGNTGQPGHGCSNSALVGGGSLHHLSGIASMLADTVVLRGADAPGGATGMFFQGTTAGTGTVFGDGLLCATGTIVRLAVKTTNAAGMVNYPQAGDAPLSVTGGVPATGGLRTYQFWYRDAASFCTGAVFNLSNGLAIQWAL